MIALLISEGKEQFHAQDILKKEWPLLRVADARN